MDQIRIYFDEDAMDSDLVAALVSEKSHESQLIEGKAVNGFVRYRIGSVRKAPANVILRESGIGIEKIR